MVMLNPKYTIENGVYEISPDLPEGVTINPQTGVISGTPTEVMILLHTLFMEITAKVAYSLPLNFKFLRIQT